MRKTSRDWEGRKQGIPFFPPLPLFPRSHMFSLTALLSVSLIFELLFLQHPYYLRAWNRPPIFHVVAVLLAHLLQTTYYNHNHYWEIGSKINCCPVDLLTNKYKQKIVTLKSTDKDVFGQNGKTARGGLVSMYIIVYLKSKQYTIHT